MNTTANQFSFLEQFVLDALRAKGFDKMSPEDQTAMLPQFVAEAERRLGLAAMPALHKEEDVVEFTEMLERSTVTPEEWLAFWHKAVPQFDTLVKKTLDAFVEELNAAVAL